MYMCTYVYSFEPCIPIHFDQWNTSLSIPIFLVWTIILKALSREVFPLKPGVIKWDVFWGVSNNAIFMVVLREYPYNSALFGSVI